MGGSLKWERIRWFGNQGQRIHRKDICQRRDQHRVGFDFSIYETSQVRRVDSKAIGNLVLPEVFSMDKSSYELSIQEGILAIK